MTVPVIFVYVFQVYLTVLMETLCTRIFADIFVTIGYLPQCDEKLLKY